jgi:hypothetical protein
MCAVQAVAAVSNAARAFAGYYELSNVVEESGQVHVTMTLTLMNPGKTTITGGIVAVLSSGPSPVLIGSFRPIRTLPAASRVTVSQTLTITAAEYASWQHGHAPRLQFLVSSGGTAIAAGIQAYQFVPPAKGAD